MKEHWGRTSDTELTGARAEQSQGRARSQIGPTRFKNRGQPQSENEPDQKGISYQQPPTIKMPTSLADVRRSLAGSGAKMLLLKGCFSACYSSPAWPCLRVGQIHGRKGDLPPRSFRGAESTPPREK